MSKLCLGIESTAHTFGVGIVKGRLKESKGEGKILADIKDTYKPSIGGLHPREMAEHHSKVAYKILKDALTKSKLDFEDIDIIAYSQGMGIGSCLKIGAALARTLSLKYNIPLVGVNHAIGHIEIGKFTTGCKDPVVVYLSGGNSQIIAHNTGRYRIYGETEDIPLGNALDKFSRDMGLGHPGGPKVEKLAKKGEKFIELPYVVKGMDLSFSGIVTEAVKKCKQGDNLEDMCYSLQEICFSMVTEVTERAMAHTGKKECLLTGGVAANERLKEMISIMCEERGAKAFFVPKKYSGDCGAQIAVAGLLAYSSGIETKIEESGVKQKWRVDEVQVPWVKQENEQ